MVTRAERQLAREKKQRARVKYVERTYGVPEEAQKLLMDYQHGRCYGCGVANGTVKALAMDHNHRSGEARMYLCGPCNQLVGRFRDNPIGLIRLGLALCWPPSRTAWARPGHDPAWHSDDPELAAWLDREVDQGDDGS